MKRLGIVGAAGSDTRSLLERLGRRLSERGAVATVTRMNQGEDAGRAPEFDGWRPEATRSHGLTDEGTWYAVEEDHTLADLLDHLAPRFEYALVEGFPDASIPTVALGDREHAGETVLTAPDADAVDVDAVVAALDEQEPFETLESLVAQAKASTDSELAGAIATFTGRVRTKESPDDTPTEFLEFEKYDGVAEERMAAIRADLEARDGVYEVLLHHRTGVVEREEDIVFVVVLAGHRSEAFETVEDGINRLKAEVPLFKKEVTADGEFWAHEPKIEK
jgi:molybdopterin synthase catalytic subunit